MNKKIKIKLFSDYICPWCYLGDAVLDGLKDKYDFEVEHIGIELHPDTKPDGNDILKQFPRSNEMFDGLRVRGKDYGLEFDRITILPNSRKALIVGEYAEELGLGKEYTLAMWKAYFGHNKNIGDTEVIYEVAESVGISKDDVNRVLADKIYFQLLQENMETGERYGVNSVPTFIIDNKFKIVGAQAESVFEQVFKQLRSGEIND